MKLISKHGRKKYALDPLYFLSDYTCVTHPEKRWVNVKLYQDQERYIQALHQSDHVLASVVRRAGTTSATIAFLIWEAIFHEDQLTFVAAPSISQAKTLCQTLQAGVYGIPAFLRPKIVSSSRNSIRFENGSHLLVGVINTPFFAGINFTRTYLDNFAFCAPNTQASVWATIAPRLSIKSRCIIASTPASQSDTFTQLWINASSPSNESIFTPFKLT